MSHLHEDKIKLLEDKKGQEIQDEIFMRMSAEKKIHLASGFFELAKELRSLGKNYGTRKTSSRSRRNP
ncbi:MAG: hypothetical protein Q7S12_00920 [bacterium]|nr:hypothetical protein [bacterium]